MQWQVGDRALARDSQTDQWGLGTVTELRAGVPIVRLDEHQLGFTWRFVQPAADGAPGAPEVHSPHVSVGDMVRVRDGASDMWKLGVVTELRAGRPLVRVEGHDRSFLWKAVRPLSEGGEDPRVCPRRPMQTAIGAHAHSPHRSVSTAVAPLVTADTTQKKSAAVAAHRIVAVAAVAQMANRMLLSVYWQKLLRLALVADAERVVESVAGGQQKLLQRIKELEEARETDVSARSAAHRIRLVADTETSNSRMLLCVYYQKLIRRALVADAERVAASVEGGQRKLLERIAELQNELDQRGGASSKMESGPTDAQRPPAPTPTASVSVPTTIAAAPVPDGSKPQFSVKVATGVLSEKHNVRLCFPTVPSLAELIAGVEGHYGEILHTAQHRNHLPPVPFRVQSFQLYDRVVGQWVDLYSTAQLQNECQLYCFQPEGCGDDHQGFIPAASRTVEQQQHVAAPTAYGAVFAALTRGRTVVSLQDLRGAFLRAGIEWSSVTAAELYTRWDADPQATLNAVEWSSFATRYPQAAATLAGALIEATPTDVQIADSLSATRESPTVAEIREQQRALELRKLHTAWKERELRQSRDEATIDANIARLRRELATDRARAESASCRTLISQTAV